jgi:dTMP kinase
MGDKVQHFLSFLPVIILLFARAFREKLKKALNEGQTVVCDRYAYSGVAFSSAKVISPINFALFVVLLNLQGLDLEWCKDPDRGLPKPDLVLFLELSVEDALKRGNFGSERYEKEEFQRKVATQFQKLKVLRISQVMA